MNKIIVLLSLSFFLSFSPATADYWLQRADVGGLPRADGTGFSIGTKGYLGTGGTSAGYSKDWWEYDPSSNVWTQKADYGGNPLVESSSFVIGNYGYVLSLGIDFWQYDAALNIWVQMANFPGPLRQAAVAFVINGKGYITTGADLGLSASMNDLWEYDPVLNSWVQKANLPGMARHYASGFSVGNKGYVGTGQSGTSIGLTDFWEWDQASDTWSQKANFPGAGRREASGFTIGNFGYLGMGSGLGVFYHDFYQYNSALDSWTQKADFGGGQREEMSQLVIGNFGYAGTGYNGITPGVAEKDFWEYHPEDSTTSINEITNYKLQFSIFPNPASEFIVISLPRPEASGSEGYPLIVQGEINLTITDVNGKKVYQTKLLTSDLRLPTSDLQKGIYFAELNNGKEKAVRKFVKE